MELRHGGLNWNRRGLWLATFMQTISSVPGKCCLNPFRGIGSPYTDMKPVASGKP